MWQHAFFVASSNPLSPHPNTHHFSELVSLPQSFPCPMCTRATHRGSEVLQHLLLFLGLDSLNTTGERATLVTRTACRTENLSVHRIYSKGSFQVRTNSVWGPKQCTGDSKQRTGDSKQCTGDSKQCIGTQNSVQGT